MSTSQDNLSPTAKAVTQNKQTVSIRKVTVESLAPVIAKVQEHIVFLIEQTSNLRKQNSNLISAQANQKALQDQIVTINTTLQKLSSNMNQFNSDKQNKLLNHTDELSEVNERITKLQRELVFQDQRIEQINGKNESYLEQISQSKIEQYQTIETLRSSLENYYQQELSKISVLNDQVEQLVSKMSFYEEKRNEDQQEMKKIANVIALYEMERLELQKVIEKTTFLEHNTVMLDEYQNYKKYNRVEMEMTKKDIRGMIDDALTPEIRKFLPTLIKRLEELNAFTLKLNQLYKALQSQKKEYSSMVSSVKQEWQKKFVYFNMLNVESTKETKTLINDEIQRLGKVFEMKQESWSQKLKGLEQDVTFNKKIAEINLSQSLKKVEEDNVKYVHSWGQKFIEEKKSEIYLIVEQMKPKQQVSKQKQIFSVVQNMQPLLKQAKKLMQISHKQLQRVKSEMSEKLLLFNNQIVKFKTDVTIDSAESKKMLESFNKKLKTNDQFNHEISQLLSKVIETTLILYGTSLDQQYLQVDKEVYVSFTDGVIVEIQEDSSKIKYRRKKLNPELLKRAVLKEYVKLIDHIILNQPLLKWEDKNLKPSFFFQTILKAYQTLDEEFFQAQGPTSHEISTSERVMIQQGNITQHIMPHIPSKGKALNQDALSKTIDFERKQYQTVVLNTPRYSKEKESSSHRKSIRLKKMEKKE